MKAMIFAAGLGTRLKPLTSHTPKALIKVAGKTLLQMAIEKLKGFGIHSVVVNVHHFEGQVVNYLAENNNFGIDISISDESAQLLDTGGGLKKAAALLSGSEPILLYNVDVLSNVDLARVLEQHIATCSLATLVVRKRETQRYLLFDKYNILVGWRNDKTGETKISAPENFENARPFAFSGIHIISPQLPGLLDEEGVFSIINAYLKLAKQHKISGYIDNSSLWMDLGRMDQLEKASEILSGN
ncbi:mannose-1-phosphate guanyltransferase [hydrothermal vent metagenome]|uniref:Mannose-1-phosphate guanyltransferase n=1 Tax=hydrothermal vent metagenome TaxID=652676 RepID=A0A3B0TQC4_9ZZZZ